VADATGLIREVNKNRKIPGVAVSAVVLFKCKKLIGTTVSIWNKYCVKSKSGGRSGRRNFRGIRQLVNVVDVADAGGAGFICTGS